ncbi:hypothetical protein ACFPRL_16795 [Pseudoclavibacter helvolus]
MPTVLATTHGLPLKSPPGTRSSRALSRSWSVRLPVSATSVTAAVGVMRFRFQESAVDDRQPGPRR